MEDTAQVDIDKVGIVLEGIVDTAEGDTVLGGIADIAVVAYQVAALDSSRYPYILL